MYIYRQYLLLLALGWRELFNQPARVHQQLESLLNRCFGRRRARRATAKSEK